MGCRLVRPVVLLLLAQALAACGPDYSRWFVSVSLSPTLDSPAERSAARSTLDTCAGAITLKANPTYASTLELVAEHRSDADAFAVCARRIPGVSVSEVMALDIDPGNRPA